MLESCTNVNSFLVLETIKHLFFSVSCISFRCFVNVWSVISFGFFPLQSSFFSWLTNIFPFAVVITLPNIMNEIPEYGIFSRSSIRLHSSETVSYNKLYFEIVSLPYSAITNLQFFRMTISILPSICF